METMIEVSSLHKDVPMGAGTLPILRGINLTVRKGEFVAIMGPSGSGKSTLLGLLAGLDNATSGSIRVAGEEITGLNEDGLARLRARHIGIVFQSFHLMPTLNALENVALPLELAGMGRKAVTAAREALQKVGLGERLSHYPRQLSGGEQQRVAIARAFAGKPAILLADEPTGNLDSKSGKAVLELLLGLCRSEGATLIMVTHDSNLASLSDRTVFIQDGALVREEVHADGGLSR